MALKAIVMRRSPGFGGTACIRSLGNSTRSPACGAGLTHWSALNGPGVVAACSLRKAKSHPPGDFMNTVWASGWVGVR